MRLSEAEAAFAPHNPRRHDVDGIADSIAERGFNAPPLLNEKTGQYVFGHGRTKGLRLLCDRDVQKVPRHIRLADDGEWMLPVIRGVSFKSKAEAEEYLVADNRLTELGGWDPGKTAKILGRIRDRKRLIGTGYTPAQVERLLKQVRRGRPVKDPDADVVPRVKQGEVWVLGRHRLMCGDSRDTQVVATLLDGAHVDLGFHDPPYGISVVKPDGKMGPVIGDDEPFDPRHLVGLGSVNVIWGANNFHDQLPRNGAWIVWDKKRPEGTNFSDVELAWTDAKKKAVPCYRVRWHGMIREGENDPRVHPTQKPIKLCTRIIEDYSGPNATVLDLYGGSGSTLVACEQIGRRCLVMELLPAYCDVTIARWEKLTGGTATSLS